MFKSRIESKVGYLEEKKICFLGDVRFFKNGLN